ncbi:MAG: phosphosulfolactate synthase [Bacteroidetes bacterium]|nr:phosphosulfolactate synthase [Bacteroidota bacterium]
MIETPKTKKVSHSPLKYLPERTQNPRSNGITMVMDKGLSLRQAEDLVSASGKYVDFIKLGFGTSLVSNNVKEKIKLYQDNNINVYVGGTLFEAFVIRNQFQAYVDYVSELGLKSCEVSDGSITLNHEKKCEYISILSKNFTVLSEVGSKEEGVIIHPQRWIKMMEAELKAGSFKVIAEARESGTVGIFHKNGSAHALLINRIVNKVKLENIIWETPQKSQQAYFIKLFGSNVNLGNIAVDDVIPTETLRLGLRGDTFFAFLPPELKTEI